MSSARMEGELKCPVCRRFYSNPVFLPCSHSLCLACAVSLQTSSNHFQSGSEENSVNGGQVGSSISEYDYPDIDKLSLLSETDSGVVCNSRPNSYVGTPSIANLFFPSLQSLQSSTLGLSCPICKVVVLLDESGANSLPCNIALENIVEKYGDSSKHYVIECQLCEGNSKLATLMCEQCEVYYCEQCRENCHPSRGPLAKHNLVPPTDAKTILQVKNKNRETKCAKHPEENINLFCVLCKVAACSECVHLDDAVHKGHEVQPLGTMCKTQKADLSQQLQVLSEKARSGTEFIQSLKTMADRVQENCVEFEASVVAQCDQLIEAIRLRKKQLIEKIQQERDHKQRVFKEQVSHCTARLQRTTGLLQFSIEVLKEPDPAAFLLVSNSISSRVSVVEKKFHKEMEFEPRVSSDFELKLDNHALLQAIQTLNFFQMKVPGSPQILIDECSAENNTVTIAWQPHLGSVVDGYILELDDGNEGEFREVCQMKETETMCSVEGLHFESNYYARVKAFNNAGDSLYSECVCLQTAKVAWFSMDPATSHPDICLSNGNMTVTSNTADNRVVMGTVGFSKGVHYWEMTINKYESDPDPAFGIARFDVSKEEMLGKDDKGWSMYIDAKRSWFMHKGQHMERTDGGIGPGSVVGVLLDLNQHILCFYVNHEPHGPIAFDGLHGVFYPAVSLNRNVQVTLQPGVNVPVDSDTEDE